MKEVTKEIDISKYRDVIENAPQDGELKVIIRRLKFGEKQRIFDQVTQVKMVGRKLQASPQFGELKILTLTKAVKSAPFPVNPEYIANELDGALGEYLYVEIDRLNSLGEEKKENSGDAGEEQEQA